MHPCNIPNTLTEAVKNQVELIEKAYLGKETGNPVFTLEQLVNATNHDPELRAELIMLLQDMQKQDWLKGGRS